MDNGEIIRWLDQGKSLALNGILHSGAALHAPVISWFAHTRERAGESWRVVLLSPHYQWTVDTFRDILNSVPLPGDMVMRHAIYARHGSVSCIPQELSQLQGMYAKHMLWVIETDKEEVWDAVVSRLEPGHLILAFGWIPKQYWSLFANIQLQEESDGNFAG